jgi:phosphopantothenoylcysteine decarboxylase/phosphopantothenate--cysteine ligase
MNSAMYENAATQANLEVLRSRGVVIVDPGIGSLASRGEFGVGRLAEPAAILSIIEAQLSGAGYSPRSLDGLRVLVTAGGTREPIDSVRFVGNRSSGRMGVAVAAEAARRGAEVTVIAANVGLDQPDGVRWIPVTTAAELDEVAHAEFASCDVLVMAAAVSDFRPVAPLDQKIKKGGRDELVLELESTADVLASLAAVRKPSQTLIGFAAEHGGDQAELGRIKLEGKRVDAVVVNDISNTAIGFESDQNEVTIVTAAGATSVPRAAKAEVAAAIVDAVEQLRTRAGARA